MSYDELLFGGGKEMDWDADGFDARCPQGHLCTNLDCTLLHPQALDLSGPTIASMGAPAAGSSSSVDPLSAPRHDGPSPAPWQPPVPGVPRRGLPFLEGLRDNLDGTGQAFGPGGPGGTPARLGAPARAAPLSDRPAKVSRPALQPGAAPPSQPDLLTVAPVPHDTNGAAAAAAAAASPMAAPNASSKASPKASPKLQRRQERRKTSFFSIRGQESEGGPVLETSIDAVCKDLGNAAERARAREGAASGGASGGSSETERLADMWFTKAVQRPADLGAMQAARIATSLIWTAEIENVPGEPPSLCDIHRFMRMSEIAGEDSLGDALLRVEQILGVMDSGTPQRRLYTVLYAGMVGSTVETGKRQLTEMFLNPHAVFEMLREWNMVFSKVFFIEALCKTKGLEKQLINGLKQLLLRLGLPAMVNAAAGGDGLRVYITIVLLTEMENSVGKLRESGMPLDATNGSRLWTGARRDRDADEACARAGVPSPRVSGDIVYALRELCDAKGLGPQFDQILLSKLQQPAVLAGADYHSYWSQADDDMATAEYHRMRLTRYADTVEKTPSGDSFQLVEARRAPEPALVMTDGAGAPIHGSTHDELLATATGPPGSTIPIQHNGMQFDITIPHVHFGTAQPVQQGEQFRFWIKKPASVCSQLFADGGWDPARAAAQLLPQTQTQPAQAELEQLTQQAEQPGFTAGRSPIFHSPSPSLVQTGAAAPAAGVAADQSVARPVPQPAGTSPKRSAAAANGEGAVRLSLDRDDKRQAQQAPQPAAGPIFGGLRPQDRVEKVAGKGKGGTGIVIAVEPDDKGGKATVRPLSAPWTGGILEPFDARGAFSAQGVLLSTEEWESVMRVTAHRGTNWPRQAAKNYKLVSRPSSATA
eukprot:COSAG04_NODE_1013_length_8768_cov_10.694544_1_plen_878_part_00